MIIGPKYKIARRLGAPVFEKTQTQKFALREGRKNVRRGRPKTDFGLQLNEKQKARMFYCLSEKQFAKYVKQALSKKGAAVTNLLSSLECRLDNIVWRSGLRPTHLGARQAVAHGHFLVNGKKTYIPSYELKPGDKVSIREGSKNSRMFTELEEKADQKEPPSWIKYDAKKKELQIKTAPTATEGDMLFDLGRVIEFYQR